jgi:hypothetical protein
VSTETELVLMSMTNEELDDANRYLAHMLDRWRESRKLVEADRDDEAWRQAGYHGTDGPIHLIRAMDLALTREWAQRGGAEPWYAGMPLEGHPSARYVRHYQERIALNPDEGHRPRLAGAGVLEKVCIGCGEARPLTVAFWRWLGSSLDDFCRSCREGRGPTAVSFLPPEPAAEPVGATTAPFSATDVADALASDLDAL